MDEWSPSDGPSRYVQAMERLVDVVQDLSQARDLSAVMAIVRLAARDLTGADGATFVLRDGDKCFYAEENAIAPMWKGMRFPMSACISGWAMINRQAAVIEDIYQDPRIPVDAYRPTFVHSLVMVPIRTRDPVGAIGNYWAAKRRPTPEEVKILQALADTTAVALENVQVYAELEQRVRDMTALTRAAPVAIVSLGPDGNVLSWNPAAEALFGLDPGDARGRPLPGISPESEAGYAALLDTLRDGGRVEGEAVKGTPRDGTPVDLRLCGASVLNEDGSLRSLLLLAQDETERNQFERKYLHAQKMDAIGQLTGGIAHDFNNLLGVLIGNLDMVRDKIENAPDLVAMVDRALEAGLRGADLNKRLLAFSRRQALQPERVDVNASIGAMVKLLNRSLGERVDINLCCAEGGWPVCIDPVQLETAIVNLCVNARDAMPNGGMLTIETRNATLDEPYAFGHSELAPGDYALVAVSDTGCGMPPEVLAKVFEPFFTTKPVGQGTGLGLSMVYGFLKQSNGHVNIYSEVGKGTTVRLYIPRSRAGQSAAEGAEKPAPIVGTGSGTILVVEDNPGMREVAVTQLTSLGYRVEQAETADQALALLDGGLVPDLLFTDVVLPGRLDGLDLARLIADRTPGLPILLTSGFTERATMENRNGRDALPFPMLDKPYRRSALAAAVHDALNKG